MLERVLEGVESAEDPRVLVGFDTADDAGVFLLADGLALVQSVDFFTPVVDDPATYGQIAAANALSDLYAMGAEPRFALSVVGFPKQGVDEEILGAILRGGASKLREAGVALIGGHSVQDPEIKFGYAVSGVVEPEKLWRNGGAQPGDHLVLTKPLGTGIITTAGKFGSAPEAVLANAIEWMLRLNRAAAALLRPLEVHAATDITGYGLLGHAAEMARAGKRRLVIDVASVPLLEGAAELAAAGHLPGGIESNRRYVGARIEWKDIDLLQQQLLLDPQTSGGLLVSLPPAAAAELLAASDREGQFARRIGEVAASGSAGIEVVGGGGGSGDARALNPG